MILYISNATDYSIFDRLFKSGRLTPAHQMQKFNFNLINGLASQEAVTSLSALPYYDISAEGIELSKDNVKFICIKNVKGRLHKLFNLFNLLISGIKIIFKKRPTFILCDAIAKSPCYATVLLSRFFRIPSIGIVTDLPGVMSGKNINVGCMARFNGYILLTEQMNGIVNPRNKPYMVMEGLCAPVLPEKREKAKPRRVIYSGSIWKNDAGIEYFTKGFIDANIPDCELHFYGAGEAVDWVREIAENNPNVKYMGCVTNEEIVKIQCEATLLVNPRPSNQEFCKYSFPSKTIEYMASGTPVLMTALPGVPGEYFEYVYTIENETTQGVSDILKEIFAKDDRELMEFGARAREFVASEKSCRAQTEKLYDFCKKL